ncbi:MAG: hypothetical protein JWS12_287 [Candidatus Saccharibacteria bacterium]|nr:hypothetical protein [Candidatus Saccharibacteria bacterium]
MSNPEVTAEKKPCFIPLVGEKCPESCVGLVATKFMRDPNGGEGFMIQVCPNPEWLGQPNSEADYCGDGADVITIHRDTVPTDEEYAQAVQAFGQ